MISIDRLALHVPAMTEKEAERLGFAVAAALRRWEPPATPIDLARLDVRVRAGSPQDRAESLARQITTAVMAAALREAGP